MVRTYFLYFLLLFLSAATVRAQFFTFGRNKVQYTEFDWHVLKTKHFDIYYYPEMEELAKYGASFAEQSFTDLQQKFIHTVSERIPLIFYSSHLHFQQTNTTPGLVPDGVGGFFEFLKGRVVIPYTGSMRDFHHVIKHELVHVFMYSKVNRVLFDHRLLQGRLPPLWFVEGLAEYWSNEWDVQAEMVMRDAVLRGYITPLSDMDKIYGTFLMYKEGQNILQYIGRKYSDEKLVMMLENLWKTTDFEKTFEEALGINYKKFDEEWLYALKKQYYPLLAESDQPSGVTRGLVQEGFNSKPDYFQNGNSREIYFIGNHSGYTSIYRIDLDSNLHDPSRKPTLVVQGEKSDELEKFHFFQNNLDISGSGIIAFAAKSGENDAIHLYDLKAGQMVRTYRFHDLVVIGSVAWSPDGNKLAFTAVETSGKNDLYVWNLAEETLEKLTNDFYDDRDPAWFPAGDKIVFTSDRTPFGKNGAHNLFTYDLTTNTIRYLTYGKESYYSPQVSSDGRALIFTSDISGARNVWMIKLDNPDVPQEMRQITRFTTAAFDPVWADGQGVFVSFEDFRFQLRALSDPYAMYDSSSIKHSIDFIAWDQPWKPASIEGVTREGLYRYSEEYSLDFAQSEVTTDPVFGTAGGAYLSMSDFLGNENYNFLIYNTAQTTDEILSSFNIAVSRVSLQHRTHYAYGVYRFSGRRYDLTDPDEFFFERVFGAYAALSYPLSVFRRIALTVSISNSEKDAGQEWLFSAPDRDDVDDARKALFLSNSLSFTHDNSLWGPTGPLDGSRYNVTLAYTTDMQYSHANYYSVIFDYRHYFRLASRSAHAVRLWLFYNDGREARRFFMGGSWDLRGYPRWSLRGKKLWLITNELRFPFLDQISLKFPIVGITFFDIRGALFVDAGNAWDENYRRTFGSIGCGMRLSIAGFLVLRYDIGKRIENNFRTLQRDIFHQFFFGWDF
jgi:hypothetical protein